MKNVSKKFANIKVDSKLRRVNNMIKSKEHKYYFRKARLKLWIIKSVFN